MICLSCTGKTIEENIELIERYRKHLGFVEIRADFLDPYEFERLPEFPKKAGLPAILTYRKPGDGGSAAEITGQRRFEILSHALSGGYGYIDIEDDEDVNYSLPLIAEAEKSGTAVIRSFHDFGGVPENLFDRLIAASEGGRFIPKAAVMPNSTSDLIRIIEISRKMTDTPEGRAAAGKGFILLGMGIYGFPTRVLAGALGSMLTFSSSAGTQAAPGHVSPDQLCEVYGYEGISRESRVYGILGHPVMHSQSPLIHNGGYRSLGIDAVYIPFETDKPELFIRNAELLNLWGLSVTIPHKQRVIPLASRVDESVRAIGACNTLVNRGGIEGWEAYNTDWIGFLEPLFGLSLEGKSALVIGAGGASRAVVYALVKRGMMVTVINRTAEKARLLASDFHCSGGDLSPASRPAKPWLVVQTTSAGMSPDTGGDPLPDFDFSGTEVVYDLIYTPEKTVFLSRAEAAGCRVVNGYPMLRAQAAEQFYLFTGCKVSF